ncbi:hypothetical protein OAT18_00525 [Tenacibaculum sp.]|nr:hypothetical protein [Tenacibaculum sp.]
MRNKPIKILLLAKRGNEYGIQFPYLSTDEVVDKYCLKKVLEGSDYEFIRFNKEYLDDPVVYLFSNN